MFVAVDRDRPPFDKTGADPVGPFAAFAPHAARGQPDLVEHCPVARLASRFEDDAVLVRQHDRAAGGGNGLEQLVEQRPRHLQHQAVAFAPLRKLAAGNKLPPLVGPRIEPVLEARTTPAGRNKRLRGAGRRVQDLLDRVFVLDCHGAHVPHFDRLGDL